MALALSAAPAFAETTHVFTTTFAGSGTNALSNPSDVAIDQKTHDVYVSDPANFRVEKFTESGEFILMFGKGVDKTTGGNLCTAASGHTCQAGSEGTTPGAFVGALEFATINPKHLFLAVDNSSGPSSGDVYVGDVGDHIISKFDSSGKLVTTWGTEGQLDGSTAFHGPFHYMFGIAVDSSGNLHEYDGFGQKWFTFAQDGTAMQAFNEIEGFGIPSGAGVDPAGRIYFVVLSSVKQLTSSASGSGFTYVDQSPSGELSDTGFAIDPLNSDVYVDKNFGGEIGHYDSPCNPVEDHQYCHLADTFGSPQLNGAKGLAVDAYTKDLYVANTGAGDVAVFDGRQPHVETGPIEHLSHTTATITGSLDPLGRGNVTECKFEYLTEAAYQENLANTEGRNGYSDLSSGGSAECAEGNTFSAPATVHADLSALTTETTYHYRLAAANANGTALGVERTFTPHAVFELQTGGATEITNASATLHGSFAGEEGIDTTYHFEYGTTTAYSHKSPSATVHVTENAPQNVSTPITELVPNTTYHYRIVAENKFGATIGEDKTFTTDEPPTIEGLFTSRVTATSALIHARINPQVHPAEAEAECHFEYGPTTAYGTSVPCPEKLSGTSGKAIEVQIEGLQRGVTYHYRVVASNQWGTVASEDNSFEFFPPNCPNAAVRQQTGANYLPDCRAYELVSPGEANGTLLFSGGPNSGQATNPSRLSYTGVFSALPGANTINTVADLYVATRTDTGWVSHYIGLPGNQAGCMGGPPNVVSAWFGGGTIVDPRRMSDSVLTDPSMDHFINWLDGAPVSCGLGNNGTVDRDVGIANPSNAPYLWNAGGGLEGRLPSNLAQVPGATKAMECSGNGQCNGDSAASGDLTHFVFSSDNLAFAPGGLTEAPGSAYDENAKSGEVSLISKLPASEGAGPIPADPAHPGDFIHFAALSGDGSRILMSTGQTPNHSFGAPTPSRLYMRVNDEVTYNVSQGKDVAYLGATPDLSKVFFSSEEQLNSEDHDHSADIYMWSEQGEKEGQPLTLVSKGDNAGNEGEAGNTDNCSAALAKQPLYANRHPELFQGYKEVPWTTKCGAVAVTDHTFATQATGGVGGNDASDTAIAANGDIYFYSPEQLDGDHGVLGQQNLYAYRGGRVQFVAALRPEIRCVGTGQGEGEAACTEGPVARMNVSPEDTHMAFVSASRLTSYDNTEHFEMYSYDPAAGSLVCDSCNPDGEAPATPAVSSNGLSRGGVQASQDGLFMTNDGRAFFSTTEALVPADTNEAEDVYEYVDGHPRLITSGTAAAGAKVALSLTSTSEVPGLVGVSADGKDVYFSTFDTFVAEDHNGSFFKFYDARTNGGFPQPTPAPPCAAAEECHGAGSAAPQLPTQGTAAALSGGNFRPAPHRHHKKAKGKRHHRRVNASRGGKK